MAEQWARGLMVLLILLGLSIIIFYIIPLQTRIVLQPRDWLTGLKWRLLAGSVSIVIAASPVITNVIFRYYGINSVLLSNLSAISVGLAFLAFSISLVSVYHYRKKE